MNNDPMDGAEKQTAEDFKLQGFPCKGPASLVKNSPVIILCRDTGSENPQTGFCERGTVMCKSHSAICVL
jgi:hypothetical protein